MFGMPVKMTVASAAVFVLLAAPAAAGGYYAKARYAGCNCLRAAPVVYGVAPVTYYVAQQAYVPSEVYVRQYAFVPVRSYIVDQGPSFDVPAVPYTAPTLYFPSRYHYPFHHDWRMPSHMIRRDVYRRGGRDYVGRRHGHRKHRYDPLSYK